MQNSPQQYANVADAFAATDDVSDGPVLLIDDLASSRWTLAVAGARLRKAGAGAVYPLVLAVGTAD
jgi:ATP-dependent DNA helicase RecQ